MPSASDVIAALEALAPLDLAESWDHVGLAIGSTSWPAARVLLTIDLTEDVLDEAIRAGASMIVAYHPPIFEPLASLTDRTARERIALGAARAGIAVYSPHTALDAAPGGVNDWLTEAFGKGDVRAISVAPHAPVSEAYKIVTFCPAGSSASIRERMGQAGAGRIGDYALCSFEIEGHGTFLGGPSTKPAVGRRGRLERVDEVRLEMVSSASALAGSIEALRACHPYEEPPIEIYRLEPRPQRAAGAGRMIDLARATSLAVLIGRLKKHLGVKRILVATARERRRAFASIAVCAGAGGSLLGAAIDEGAELFVTGELRHHDVLDATARGCAVALAGHTNTERGYLKRLKQHLARRLAGIEIRISKRDVDPLRET